MLEIVSNKIEVLRYLTTDEMNVKLNWESSLKTFFRWKCNLRSGPILEVLIHSLLRLSLNVGPDTNSHKFVLTAARFWPQRWLAVRTMPQDLIGCWNQRKLKALIPCVVVFANDQPSAERRIDFAVFFIVLWSYGRKICLNMCHGN